MTKATSRPKEQKFETKQIEKVVQVEFEKEAHSGCFGPRKKPILGKQAKT